MWKSIQQENMRSIIWSKLDLIDFFIRTRSTMSFNRGVKRDSFGNRGNFNRSGGGGGGSGNRGNNNMGNSGIGNNMGGGMSGSGGMSGMNPWEGGMMPGGRGILPTPNNNLSLTSQTQLALASNLLTNLLRTHTQEVQPQV